MDIENHQENNSQLPPDKETPLLVAANRGHIECVENLIESGASLDEQDQDGNTALHLALQRRHIDIALYLMTKGCNINISNNNGDTPLHIASELGMYSAAQTLCQLDAEVNMQNMQGFSPLHIASKNGHIDIVRCLCLSGANIYLKTNDGLTAEIIALSQENKQIASLLSKVKLDKTKDHYVDQLKTLETSLRRIKLKIFGHPGSGKSSLIQSLQIQCQSSAFTFMENVSRRFSDNFFHYGNSINVSSTAISPADTPLNTPKLPPNDAGSFMQNGSAKIATTGRKTWPINCEQQGHQSTSLPKITQGIDIQNAAFPECGEFSVWDFSGQESFHCIYDHFVGNTDCVHVVVIRCSADPTEEYKELCYWFNFLKGRVTPSEPIGHCGTISRRSVVAVVGTYNGECPTTTNESEAMMRTLKLRFETHFEISNEFIPVDLSNLSCPGHKLIKEFLRQSRENILLRLQRPLKVLDSSLTYLNKLREELAAFPCITWPYFTNLIRNEVNPLAGDSHCRQLIQQLQLIGEVVYLRDESSELDYIILSPDWLGTHIIGTVFSASFTQRSEGVFSPQDFASVFPEITDPMDMIHLLETLQLCAPIDMDFEYPSLIRLEPPKDIWLKNRLLYVYGGVRIKPMHGMESSLTSIFPRIQVAMRRSMQDFQDPLDAMLLQWRFCSKMLSGQLEALIRLLGESIEIQIRGPAERAASCFYFLEDLSNLVEQTTSEVAPGMSTERHFLSPKHLKEHRLNPASFAPEQIMEMQQEESLIIKNSDGEEEMFTDVVCFGSKEVATLLTLGIDISVSQLQFSARSELATLLDPPDSFGRDWSILAVKLGLMEQLPEVDSTGQCLSRTDQLLAEWSLRCPEAASIGKLCLILKEMGREDAKNILFRRTPLYLFTQLNEIPQIVNGQK